MEDKENSMNDNDWEGYEEYERERGREVLHMEADRWEDIQRLKEYINRLEAERDYYQNASEFAGVANLQQPKVEILNE